VQKAKRNHWVAQSYLRAFAADGDRRQKIWRFSKEGGAPELKPIENVAVRFHLYAPKRADGSMQGRNIAGSASNVLDFSARVENTSLAIYSQA